MLKLTKTGIGLLTKQYRSVLRKCLLLNLGLLLGFISTSYAWFDVSNYENIATMEDCDNNIFCAGSWHGGSCYGVGGDDILSLALKTRLKEKGISVSYGTSFTSEQLIQVTRDIMFGTYIRVGDWTPTSKTFNGKSYSSNLTTYSSTYSTTTSVGKNLEALDFAVIKAQADVDYINDVTFNYYYTFRVDERAEAIDSTSFFQKDFSTLQKVDLQSKNPTHLGAFTKCDEACPRPSERFSLSLSQEQMLKNDASIDAGTSRHCLRQFGDVLAYLLKNTAAKSLRISEFMNEEVRHA